MTLRLKDFAGGITIDDGSHPITNAIAAGIAAAQNDGQELVIGPGLYRVEQPIMIPDNVSIRGFGSATSLMHAPGAVGWVAGMLGQNARLRHVGVHGGIGYETPGGPSNCSDDHGYVGPEVYVAGSGNVLDGVMFSAWNDIACVLSGDSTEATRCRAIRTPPSSYKPSEGPTASRDLGGRFGFLCPGTAYVRNLRMLNCTASGTRGPGYLLGGMGSVFTNLFASECHLQFVPYNPDDPKEISGGGMIALGPTWAGWGPYGNQPPADILLDRPWAYYSSGPAVTGIEIGGGIGIDVRSPHLTGVQVGISVRASSWVRVDGGFISNCSTAGAWFTDSMHVTCDAGIQNCPTGVKLVGASDYVDVARAGFYANQQDVDHSLMTGAHLQYLAGGGW